MNTINPSDYFSKEILNYQVNTSKFGMTTYVNLDNAATTPSLQWVMDAVNDYMISYGSVHRWAWVKSQLSTDLYEKSRDTIRSFVNAPSDSYVLYTWNTTGAMNTAAYFFRFLEGKVAVSAIEHSSSWLPWIKSEGENQLGKMDYNENELDDINDKIQSLWRDQVLTYDVDENFEFDLEAIEELLKDNEIKVFVLTASSNVTGYIPPIKEIWELVHKYGAYFFVDGCQYIQHHKMDMQELWIDFLAASAHKFYAPMGGGFLIWSKEFMDKFLPYQIGWWNLPYITDAWEFLRYNNQLAHDPGTPNALWAVAMAKSLGILESIGIENIEVYEKSLCKKAFDGIKDLSWVEIYVSENNLNTVLPFNLVNFDPNVVAKKLNDDFGIGVRAGSFCTYHVIRKLLHIEDETEIIDFVKSWDVSKIPWLVRASFALCNTESDVDRFVNAIEYLLK